MSKNSLLCLGDSYTIGEGVALHESFPYQLLQSLRNEGFDFYAPEIIAKTGWTSFELSDHLSHTVLSSHYDFVTLLIGVNNQYRNLAISEYKKDFQFLLSKSIALAKNNAKRVIVISIPDWSVTPFAQGRNTGEISRELEEFNQVCKEVTLALNACYVDITPGTKEAENNPLLLTADQLHPSAIEYKRWAKSIKEMISAALIKN